MGIAVLLGLLILTPDTVRSTVDSNAVESGLMVRTCPDVSLHTAYKKTSFFSLIITKLIWVYQKVISPRQGDVCNFTPSCSHYAYKAIKKHGLRGVLMTFDRLERCNYFAWQYRDKYYEVKRVKDRGYKLYDTVDISHK